MLQNEIQRIENEMSVNTFVFQLYVFISPIEDLITLILNSKKGHSK